MILLLRALARLVTVLVLAALALAGLAGAIFAIGSGDGDLSLPGLLRLVEAPAGRDEVAQLLDAVEADGPTAVSSALGGAAAVVAGLLLLVGLLAPRRERLVHLERPEEGPIDARRRPLAAVARSLAEQPREVHAARARVRPRRRGTGGRLRVSADHARSRPADQVSTHVREQLLPLTESFPLRLQVRTRSERGVE